MSSQSITITTEQAKEAIRNAQRVESLRSELNASTLLIARYKNTVVNLEKDVTDLELINNLAVKNYAILETRYEALKAEKDPSYRFGNFLMDAGKIGLGVLVGVVGILVM